MKRLGSIKELHEFIIGESRKRTLITFHSMGDMDSVSSAVGIAKFFPESKISSSDRITANANRIINDVGYDESLIGNGFDRDAELVILVDVNNFEGCGKFKEELGKFKGGILVIDHHAETDLAGGNIAVFDDESYDSTASIVFELLRFGKENIDYKTAKLLLIGIISDSAEFKNSTPGTFSRISELLTMANMDYVSLLEEINHVVEPEERILTIEDLAGAKRQIVNGLLLLYGKSHAHANIAADYAIKIGADVSLFWSENREEIAFSARLRPPLDKRRDMHMGKVMKSLAQIIDGNGGGHPCAAGAYGRKKSSEQEFIEEFISRMANARKYGSQQQNGG